MANHQLDNMDSDLAIELLGLSVPFDERSLKSAFKAAAKINHPDSQTGSNDKFLRVKLAYEYLLSSLQQHTPEERGEDIEFDMRIDWNTFLNGSKQTIELTSSYIKEECRDCNGSGIKSSNRLMKCVYCLGIGSTTEKGVLGQKIQTPCINCHGTGKIRLGSCRKCDGSGSCFAAWSYEMEVPPGLFPGNILKLRQKGGPGNPRGDLSVRIFVDAPPGFELSEDNVVMTVNIDYASYILGGTMTIRDLYNDSVNVNYPGVNYGDTVVVSNGGVKLPRKTHKSSLIIKFKPVAPKMMSKRSILLLNELKEEWNRVPLQPE